jgi:heptosyltransferase-3
MGSFSGGLYSFLTGARWRVGYAGAGERFLNVRLPRPAVSHAYDSAPALADALGASCADHPLFRVGNAEAAEALRALAEHGLAAEGRVRPFVALFAGGHLHKRWPPDRWLALARELESRGLRFAIFVGPEEGRLESALREEPALLPRLVSPRPLRAFAAMLARSRLVVTPDSGPMHLAVALGVPTIALFQNRESDFYRPRGAEDRALFRPTVEDVLAAVASHPRGRELRAWSDAVPTTMTAKVS